MNNKTVLGVTLSRLIGLILFLILFAIASILQIDNLTYIQVINFLSVNLWIIIILSIFFYIGELFFVFKFPFNLPGPIFNAIGGVLLVGFFFRMFYFIGNILMEESFYPFKNLEPLIYFLVFAIVIIAGYIFIFINIKPREENRRLHKKYFKNTENELDEIGEELKEAAHSVMTNIKKSLEPKKEKKKYSGKSKSIKNSKKRLKRK
jgi:amino acid transporter